MTEEKAKAMLEELGQMQEDGRAAGLPCPRCGHDRMNGVIVRNALSRRARVYICDLCGLDEALRDAAKRPPLPFTEWGMIQGFDADADHPASVTEDDFGMMRCGICGAELLCDENGDMPDTCPQCGSALDYGA